MKNRLKTLTLTTAISASFLACGGSGGDGRDARIVSGLWNGTLTKITDSCVAVNPASITISHSVTQNEDAVNLVAESGVTFLGNTVGEDGFSVRATHSSTAGGLNCQDETQIEYDEIDTDTDTTADVDIDIQRSCPGQGTCSTSYTGTVVR